MPDKTKILGIFQGDVIVRTAIIEGMRRLYSDPDLLHSVFESLAQDDMTLKEYGESQIKQAQRWFLENKVPVHLSVRVANMNLPCITIALRDSIEADQTHGDVNYETQESTVGDWPPLTKPFTPTSYSTITGMMQLPQDTCADVIVAPGMYIVTRNGNQYVILDELDDGLIAIQPGTIDDFTGCVLKGAQTKYVTTIESVTFKETYEIGIHTQGEPVNTIYLHSIIKFLLLKYKQDLLEARNFERTTLASSDLRRNMEMENELAFDRFITMTGFCRQWWPKKKSERIQVINSSLVVAPAIIFETPSTDDTNEPLTDQGLPPNGDTSWAVKT